MFWYWVGAVVLVVLLLAAWSSFRSKRLRGSSTVTSQGAFNAPRKGLSRSETAKAESEVNTTRPDRHAGGSF